MRVLWLSILATAFLGQRLPAQAASYTYFGTGYCSTPSFTVTGLPTLGGTFVVQTEGSYGGFFGVGTSRIITGFSSQSWGGVSLPYSIPGFFCGPLLVSVDFVLPVPTASPGTLVSIPFTVPNDAALLGASFYQQVVLISQNCFKMGCGPPYPRFTRGGQGVIGY